MTQYDFIKQFLPDFEKKLLEEIPDYYSQRGNQSFLSLLHFSEKHFEEALQSFAENVCKKQREICASDAKCKYNNDIFQYKYTSIYSLVDSILNSPTPNISDL